MNRQLVGNLSLAPQQADKRTRVDLALRSRAARQQRAEVFGPSIAREIPWDILLVLYTNERCGPIKVTSLQADVSAPMTTVLRWLQTLEKKGLIVREQHPKDRRIVHVALSERGSSALDQYFEELLANLANG